MTKRLQKSMQEREMIRYQQNKDALDRISQPLTEGSTDGVSIEAWSVLHPSRKDQTIPFGKYQGQTVDNVIKKDRRYLSWLLTTVIDLRLEKIIKHKLSLPYEEKRKSKRR